jgi:hypothetical protein
MVSLKSLCSLWTALAKNHRYQGLVEEKDIETFNRRALAEGLPFLTTTLPTIGKALDNSFATSEWEFPTQFEKGPNLVPEFLGNAIKEAVLGNSVAVDCVRQLTYLFYKLEVDHDEELVSQFLDQFCLIDSKLPSLDELTSKFCNVHTRNMSLMIRRILCNENPLDIRPCHGSGATACRTRPEDKWHRLRYYSKLDAVYPYGDYFFFNHTHLVDEMDKLEDSVESVPRARVILVPKDSRGPRIISAEPAELMYIQQGLMRKLYRIIENHKLTAGQINFTDQGVNRHLAWAGSKFPDTWATIDLSEASDRVSLNLVKRVFPADWVKSLEACRSESTELPDGRIVELNKFAPMGSACCFPVEALVFWTSAKATLRRLGAKNVPVYVYGDDIILPTQFCKEVMDDLETIGLVVNRRKSYWQGPFRESCGGDYHNGYDVTPVRFKKNLTKSSPTSLAAGADLCNIFIHKLGYWASLPLIEIIESMVGYQYPRSERPLPMTVRFKPDSRQDAKRKTRFNKNFQRVEHRILQLSTRVLTRRPPDWNELLKKELSVKSHGYTIRRSPLDNTSEPLLPGQYTDSHSVRAKWAWVWLG